MCACATAAAVQVTSAGQAAVLGIARQLPPRDLRTHLLSALAGLERHPEDEVRCILAELAANIGAEIATVSVEADLLPLLLRLASDPAYLVRKASFPPLARFCGPSVAIRRDLLILIFLFPEDVYSLDANWTGVCPMRGSGEMQLRAACLFHVLNTFS